MIYKVFRLSGIIDYYIYYNKSRYIKVKYFLKYFYFKKEFNKNKKIIIKKT